MDQYEHQAFKEIQQWKNPQLNWFETAMRSISKPVNSIGNKVLDIAILGDVVKKTMEGLIGLCGDTAHSLVRHDAIFQEFRDDGHAHIQRHADIFSLPLKDLDKTVGWLGAKYKGIALAEGTGTGATGLPGLLIDIPALLTMNLRAIGEYATYYGFDVRLQQERLFALNVLAYASSPSDVSKTIALAQLVKISTDIAKKQTWKQLENAIFVKIIQEISKTLGIRLTKAKLAQSIPIAGALVGGGFNCYFTMSVCDAAYYLYRERYLVQKYGLDIIAPTASCPDSYEPEYPEEKEFPEI